MPNAGQKSVTFAVDGKMNYGQWDLTWRGSGLWWCTLMNNLGKANNELINRIYPLPSDLLGTRRMETIDFLHGPGCSLDVVCRLPTMCIDKNVLCLANGTLQKAQEGWSSLFVSWGHLICYLPQFSVNEKLCLQADNNVCMCVWMGVYLTDRDNMFKKPMGDSITFSFLTLLNLWSRCCSRLL